MTEEAKIAVLKAINAVAADLAAIGISKDRKNQQQNYSFRGIDDMYNAIAPLLAKHKLVILPSYEDRVVVERESQKGGALFYVNVSGKYVLVSAEDGSAISVGPFYGEAMDSGDKATNKAQSASFKYMVMQTFCIPTQGDNDADATTHEVRPNTAKQVSVDAFHAMPPDEQKFIQERAVEIIALHENGQDIRGYAEGLRLDSEEKLALWSLLPSNVRSALKRKPELEDVPQ